MSAPKTRKLPVSIYTTDWYDLESVMRYAKRMAKEANAMMIVFKHPDRDNFNIAHASKIGDHYKPSWVVEIIKPKP